MPKLTKADLNYNDYSWKAIPGDDPNKTKEDADRFSRKEGYEVLSLLNSLTGQAGSDLDIRTRQIAEWMIHEKMPSNVQGRKNVTSWIVENFKSMKEKYPF